MQSVSIPHWFSLNPLNVKSFCLQNDGFHPTLVLAQRIMQIAAYDSLSGFHPTLVLAQLNQGLVFMHNYSSFPSHIGSRSTHSMPFCTNSRYKFPSHIGSRSTNIGSTFLHPHIQVSIPHWFSLNTETNTRSQSPCMFPSHIGSRST